MRKGLIAFVLPLLLLLAQQGALLHALGHDLAHVHAGLRATPPQLDPAAPAAHAAQAGPQAQPAPTPEVDKLCLTCLAYAGMAAPLQATWPPLPLAQAHEAQPLHLGRAGPGAAAPAPRSRGPPRAGQPIAT
ncbi:MAG: hypothetical protein KGJ24_10270 [Burkholderiales bacterium]|nr:hypothetical protein [Burkholderiales bacterium]